MNTSEVIQAWGKILKGGFPSLSIEVTRECPLRCPGCYAYEPEHLGGGATLRDLVDYKGDALVRNILEVVQKLRPLHVSLVGGDPLVRYRELQVLVPRLLDRGIHVQIVTSAFRPIPAEWSRLRGLNVVVSIDGLQPEHDERRKPATYARILKNIDGQKITVHCTITSQMTHDPGYLEEFLSFWSERAEVSKVWFSLFTPQVGAQLPEILTTEQRKRVIGELSELRHRYRKLDMPEKMLREFITPPRSPSECVFARTTKTISADLKSEITPCQFGGEPDCGSCGCIASMGLAAIARHKLAGLVPVGALLKASLKIGQMRVQPVIEERPQPQFTILE